MRAGIALLAGAAVALSAAAAQAAAPAVEIKDAVARVVVIPEDRADVRVEILTANRRLPLKITTGRSRTIVDGGLHAKRIRSCSGAGRDAVVRVAGVGEVPFGDMPQIVVHAPRDVDLSAGGAVFGAVGRTRNLTLGAAGCGDWTIGNVAQRLRLSLADAVVARAGSAGEAKLRMAGGGAIATAAVEGRVDVDLAGAGAVRVKSVAGPLDAHLAGSGDIAVDGGHASAMTASVAGTGRVVFGGTADSLQARIVGSGVVRARQVRGPVTKGVVGSGVVRIG
jgi:hypothetical protein